MRTRNFEDSIYTSANGSVTIVSIVRNAMNNYTGMVTLGVNSSAIPAAVGGGEMGPGIGQIPPNRNNFSRPMRNRTVTTLTTTTVRGAATTFFISLSTILFIFLLHI